MPTPLLLHIETSSPVCSVALSKNGELISLKELGGDSNHASLLTLMIDQIMTESNTPMKMLDAIVISAGPGSYTGLRIGAATAKGLCYALDKPLIEIDSLQALSVGMGRKYKNSQLLFCPSVDARRNEIYYGLFQKDGVVMIGSKNIIVTADFLRDQFEDKNIVIGGSGAAKCRDFPTLRSFDFDLETRSSSRWMVLLAEKKFNHSEFSEPIHFEPNYIKPAFITPARKAL